MSRLKKKFINLTPYPVVLFWEDGHVEVIEPSGDVLEVKLVDEDYPREIADIGINLIYRRLEMGDTLLKIKQYDPDAVLIVTPDVLMALRMVVYVFEDILLNRLIVAPRGDETVLNLRNVVIAADGFFALW